MRPVTPPISFPPPFFFFPHHSVLRIKGQGEKRLLVFRHKGGQGGRQNSVGEFSFQEIKMCFLSGVNWSKKVHLLWVLSVQEKVLLFFLFGQNKTYS